MAFKLDVDVCAALGKEGHQKAVESVNLLEERLDLCQNGHNCEQGYPALIERPRLPRTARIYLFQTPPFFLFFFLVILSMKSIHLDLVWLAYRSQLQTLPETYIIFEPDSWHFSR